MRAGALRHIVEVQAASEAQDDDSQAVKVWTTLATRRANVGEEGGTEQVESGQQTARGRRPVIMRNFTGLTPAHRLVRDEQGQVLNIESVDDPEGRRREMSVTCVEDKSASAGMKQLVNGVLTLYPIVGRPASTSALLRCVSPVEVEAYYRWGTAADALFTGSTTATVYRPFTSIDATPTGLDAATKYYYTFYYRRPGAGAYTEVAGSFRTARGSAEGFTFDIFADGHMWPNHVAASHPKEELYLQAMANIADDAPDGVVCLGDTFHSEHNTAADAHCTRDAVRRHMYITGLWGDLFADRWLAFVLGNHDGEQKWRDEAGDPLPGYARNARKLVIPNPAAAVTSDIGADSTDGENCFTFVWGAARFIILDPYAFTGTKPYSGPIRSDIEGSDDNWDWTLGSDQWWWLKNTLDANTSPFVFVFIHHLVGGVNTYGRGGIEAVNYEVAGNASYEWGGQNESGDDCFSEKRADWDDPVGIAPIHDILAACGATVVVFKGHDHVGVAQELDGVYYHTVGKPDATNYGSGYYVAGEYAEGTKVSNSHHVRVAVTESECTITTIAAVRSGDATPAHGFDNGETMHEYTVAAP